MLTGKAKSDFEKWYWNDWLTVSDRDYYEKDEVIQNVWKAEKLFLFPLIIEWLDSVCFYVELNRATQGLQFKWWYYTLSDYRGTHLNNHLHNIVKVDNRQQATEKAIIKSNEIYNSQ